MFVAVCVFAAIALFALLVLVVLVSVASRHEDHAWTLTEPAPGAARSIARRLLGLRSRNAEWLRQAGRKDRRRAVRRPAMPWEMPED
jgi:hypothetical protein